MTTLFTQQGLRLEQAIARFSEYPDELCKQAYDFFDDKCPRESMEAMAGVVRIAGSVAGALLVWKRHGIDKAFAKMSPMGAEWMCLAAEHTLRQHRKEDSK